jgi:hypothetical protein
VGKQSTVSARLEFIPKLSGLATQRSLISADDSVQAARGRSDISRHAFAPQFQSNLPGFFQIVFDRGTVDFSPLRSIVPGPAGAEFPPQSAVPGAVGDADYSPLVSITNAGGVIYNAPMIAFDVDASQINFPNGNVDYSKLNDQVLAIDPYNMTVTFNLINGFSFGRPVWYLSMDTSIPLAAAIEHNTYTPLMDKPLGLF